MNCQQAYQLISAAVDGELSCHEKEKFFQHLAECTTCTEEFNDAMKTKLIIKERIIRFTAPQTLINSIMHLTRNCSQESNL